MITLSAFAKARYGTSSKAVGCIHSTWSAVYTQHKPLDLLSSNIASLGKTAIEVVHLFYPKCQVV